MDTIAGFFNEQLNISAAGDPVATLSYKDGKVNFSVKYNTQLFNLKISEDIKKVLNIKCNTSNSGEPVDVDKIAFNNTKNIFLSLTKSILRYQSCMCWRTHFIRETHANSLLSQ